MIDRRRSRAASNEQRRRVRPGEGSIDITGEAELDPHGGILRYVLARRAAGEDTEPVSHDDAPKEKVMPSDEMYHQPTPKIAERRKELAPHTHEAFEAFSRSVFAEGALPVKTKQLIAVAVAHTTQCPYCIQGHTRLAHRKGASDEEIMEAIWVAAEMRAGGAYAHSTLALDVLERD